MKIRTMSGRIVCLLEPDPAQLDIRDIAGALSRICRYGGRVRHFYSVGEHSVLIAKKLMEDPTRTKEEAFAGLLHDAAEAYMGDMTWAVRKALPGATEMDDRLSRAVADRFGVIYPWPESVRECDLRIVADEEACLMPNNITLDWGEHQRPQKLGVRIFGWTPEAAESEFLSLFQYLARVCA